ncbi:MAG: pyroglutamyl-peptidase I [Tessaracoccus sp.]|uniref:pyroglutamyl-peptidase I family protein n=1 Tax=Tessaracoccus sp. TaxID=1971211 RepID=UPI001EB9A199|nr:hypothetical protein [Tessaracoccus sp.]MBK7821249.1 pyroglutamyl-peptidase I [Tessaracoccus sp.]
MPRTILLTGFEPFAGARTNPSATTVRNVARRWTGTDRLVVEVLPVEFEASAARMRALISEHRPDAVISVGLAAGRAAVSLERVALNLIDARIPDNAGRQPIDVPSLPGASPAALASVPVKAWERVLRDAGVPVELSLSAGTFVCNHVFATAALTAPDGVRVGFIHIPWSDEDQVDDAPSLSAATLARAVELLCLHAFEEEISTTGGTIA